MDLNAPRSKLKIPVLLFSGVLVNIHTPVKAKQKSLVLTSRGRVLLSDLEKISLSPTAVQLIVGCVSLLLSTSGCTGLSVS